MATITTPAPPKAGTPRPPRPRKVCAPRSAGFWTYAALVAFLLGSLFPVYWSLIVASQSNDAIGKVPPVLVPGGHLFENIARVFDTTAFGQALFNSFLVSSTVT